MFTICDTAARYLARRVLVCGLAVLFGLLAGQTIGAQQSTTGPESPVPPVVKTEILRADQLEPLWRLTVTNPGTTKEDFQIEASLFDWIGRELASVSQLAAIAGGEALSVTTPFRASGYGHYRAEWRVTSTQSDAATTGWHRVPALTAFGDRPALLLNGEWDYQPAPAGLTGNPGENWTKVPVPATVPVSDCHFHRFRRSFALPDSMAGRLLKLCFAGVNTEAKVRLNGIPVGEHLGGFESFVLDVTEAARVGKANVLEVDVIDEQSARESGREFGYVPSSSQTFFGIWMDVAIEAVSPVHVKDVFVKPKLSPDKSVELDITIRNEDSRQKRVSIENLIKDDSGVVKTFSTRSIELNPGEENLVHLTEAWEQARLWWPHDPHLYELHTVLKDGSAEGPVLDRVVTRFGFREVKVEQTHLLFNGVRMRNIGVAHLLPNWAEQMDGTPVDWDKWELWMRRIKDAGHRMVRLHIMPQNPRWMDLADEVGIFLEIEGTIRGPDRDTWQDIVRRSRNHPSVLWYSLENEEWQGREGQLPRMIGLAKTVKEMDATRPIMYEGDEDPGGCADIISLHYPHDPYGGYCLYPEAAYAGWLDKPATWWFYANIKWTWQRDKPLHIGELGYMPHMWRNVRSLFLGEGAYYPDAQWYRGMYEWLKFEVPAMRYYGILGYDPWLKRIDLNDEYAVSCLQDMYRDLTFNFRDYDSRFYAGRQVRRTVFVHNDTFAQATLTLTWDFVSGERSLASGNEKMVLQPTGMQEVAFDLTMPLVEEETPLRLEVTLYRDEEPVLRKERPIRVFPVSAERLELRHKVGLIDPEGHTLPVLAALGVSATSLAPKDIADFQGGILVIGDEALTQDLAEQAGNIAQYVSQGGAVICLRQSSYPDWLPIKVNLDPDHEATIAYKSHGNHPVMQGVGEEDIKFWYPGYLVAQRSILKPSVGNFRSIVQGAGNAGLAWSPLLEVMHGQGRYLLSQLNLIAKFETEPMARRILANLLTYADTFERKELGNLGVMASEEGTLCSFLNDIDVRYEHLGTRERKLSDFAVVMIEGTDTGLSAATERLPELKAYLQGGGTVWLHDLEPGSESFAASVAGRNLGELVEPIRYRPYGIVSDGNLVWGISNYDICWHETKYARRVLQSARYLWEQRESSPATVLAEQEGGLGALVKVPRGQGILLLDQITWDTEKAFKTQANRYFSTLATNAGIACTYLGQQSSIRPEDFRMIELAPYCNMGFTDEIARDGKGGWVDDGPKDLSKMKPGILLGPISVFRIIDPTENDGKSCIVLKGHNTPEFPAEVRGIRIGLSTRALYFLHTAAWCDPPGTQVTAYIVHYEDGTVQEVPVISGESVVDWTEAMVDLPQARLAWRGTTLAGQRVGLHALEWLNYFPHKKIATVDFAIGSGSAVPVLLAISAER